MTMEKTSASLSSRHPYALASSVGEALFSQFRDYANRAIVNGDIMSNAVYEKAIEGLQVAAPQAGDFILDKLLAWRTETLSHVGLEPPGPISVLHKRLIVESFFLEATFQIFNASASAATRHQLNEVQTLAFDWVINGEKYVDIRNSSLYGIRDKIMNSAARLLGAISEVNLDTITERFLSEISLKIKAEANSTSRQELYSLCHGLRFVRIKGDDLQQIFSAIKFLEAVFPLRHVAPDKKSRLQQAITEMMTSVLTPLVDEGDPDHFVSNYDNETQRKWYDIISLLRSELTKWTIKQSKQAHAGLPAITVLTCLLRREDFLSEIDQLIDILHRNLKDKKNVSVVLLCIVRCVKCFYFRMGGKGSSENSDAAFMVRWTHKVTSSIVQSALKGQLSTFEQLDLLRKLVTVVTNHLPEYGVRSIILELLAIDGVQQPWEATMAGLMSVMSILVEAPGRFAGQRLNIKLPETATALDESMAATPALSGNHYQVKIGFGGTPWSPDRIACDQLLEVVKHSHNPLEAYGISSFMPLISTAVGKILQQCHQLHGYTRLTNAARPSTEVSTSQKMSALSIFIATLQLIPFIIPDQWLHNSIKEDLPGYIIHAEPSVRRVAIDACKRCMLALPAAREAIVFCLTKFTVHLQEDHIDIIRNNLELLVDLTSNWNQIAISERRLADVAGKSAASPAIQGTFSNFSDMEGTVFVMLCALDVQIRKLAIKLLEQVRTLHRTVTLTSQQSHLWSTDRTMDESRGESHRFRTSFHATYNDDDLENIVDGDSVPILSLPPNLRRVNVSSTQTSAHHARRSTYGSIASLPTVSSNTSRALPTPAFGDNCASFKTMQDDSDDIFYVADVIERFGDCIAQKCYWDFGPWGDIWREWRALPEDNYNFMDCLSRLRTNEDSIRWSRILCELCKELFIRCEQSAFVLHKEIVSKLLALASLDSSGRQTLPTDGSRGELARNYVLCGAASPVFDSTRSKEQRLDSLDFVRLLISSARTTNVDCSAVLGLGYINPSCHIIVVREVSSLLKENASSTGAASGTGTVGGSRSGPIGGLAGNMKSSRSGGPKREDIRLFQAHVFRIVASNLLPGSLIENAALRECLVEFVAETSRFITVTVDVSPELQQLRFCLCSVSRACSYQLAVSQPQYFPSMLRKQLFDKFSLYCEDGRTPGLFRSELKRHISAAKAAMKGRDADLLHHLETDIVDASEMLEHAAYLGMASMLAGNAFDVNSRDPKGRVFLWINRMLTPRDESGIPIQAKRYKQHHIYIPGQVNRQLGKTDEENHGAAAWGPPKAYTAHIALRNLLNSNTDLGGIFADHSYSSNQQIGTTYFLVLAEIYNSMSIEIEEHIVVSLVLQKIIDPLLEVRDAAQAMFRTMVKRHKMHVIESEDDPINIGIDKSPFTGFTEGKREEIVSSRSNEQMAESFEGAVVVGCLPESHQAFQLHISSILAREHAELSHNVVREVLMRQQQCIVNKSGYDFIDKVLLCLQPWFEYAAFHRGWEGQWNVDILQGMYSITSSLQKTNQRLMSIQKLWMTVLSNRRNTFPVLDFLLKQGVAATAEASLKIEKEDLSSASAMNVVLEPGKNVALYLSRVAPRQVIDLLVYEAALQLTESEELSIKNSSYLFEQQQQKHANDVNASDAPKKDQEKRMNEHIRIKEFHHKPALAPLQAPLPHQQPLAAHAAAAVAAATSGASKALTPASIALAIKRSTIDLVIKTGAAVADTVAVAGAAAVGTFAAQGLGSPDTMPAGMPRQTKYFEDSSRNQVDFIQSQDKYYDLGDDSVNIDDKEHNNTSVGLISASTPEPPKTRLALNRPEIALCLLSEIVCEKDEEFRTHLSQLLHVAVLHIDSINPTVRLEAFQILQYLLYSLSYKQLENEYVGHSTAHNANQQGFGHQGNQSNDFSADFARVSGVIEYLQSMSGEALWKWELPTLTQPWIKSAGYVAAFVQIVADCFPFDTSLREKWSDEALKWSCCAASRHGASRSHQVFCALGPSLNSKASTALLAALAKCLNNATVEGLDTAVEILCTLRVLLDNTPSSKIPLYPHLFAACVALLNSSVVRIGELAYALLLQLLANLDLSSPAIQQNILSVLPLDFWDDSGNFGIIDDFNESKVEFASDIINLSDSFLSGKNANGHLDLSSPAWLLGKGLLGGVPEIEDDVTAGGPWLAIQQLLVKGLLQAETIVLSLKSMAAIARQISSALAHKSHFFTRETYRKTEIGYGEPVGNQHENIRTGFMKSADLSYASKEIANYSGGIEDILGSTEVGMVISIAAALPWICVHLANDDQIADVCREFLHEISLPLEFIQCEELACMFSVLSDDTPEEIVISGYITWLPDLIEVICKSFFPKYARLVVQRLMETISRAGLQYQEAALTILQCIFEVPDVNLGPSSWFSHDSHLVDSLSHEVGGPLTLQVLALLEAMARFQDSNLTKDSLVEEALTEPAQLLEWPFCIDDLGESNKVCSEALRRVVESCPGIEGLANAISLPLPNLLNREGDELSGAQDVQLGTSSGEQLLPFLQLSPSLT